MGYNMSGEKDEQPMHEVKLDNFCIGCYQVTFDEYDIFCEYVGREKPEDNGFGRGRRPVINVTWYDACEYCDWLSKETCSIYRLPTEAEWEYACKAGSNSAWFFGDFLGDLDKAAEELKKYAWYKRNSTGINFVGTKQPNKFGLHDMYGNVCEWCKDYYNSKQYKNNSSVSIPSTIKNLFYNSSTIEITCNPVCLASSKYSVIRGGSWRDDAWFCRSFFFVITPLLITVEMMSASVLSEN